MKNFPFNASFEAQPPPAVTLGLSAFLRLNSLGVASCLQNEMGRMKLCSSQTKRVGFQMLQESNSTGLSRHTYVWTGQAGRLVSRHHQQQQPLPRSHTPTFLGWSVATKLNASHRPPAHKKIPKPPWIQKKSNSQDGIRDVKLEQTDELT